MSSVKYVQIPLSEDEYNAIVAEKRSRHLTWKQVLFRILSESEGAKK